MSKLTQEEIFQALLKGKKIQKSYGTDKMYYYFKDGIFINQHGCAISKIDLEADWELYIETVTFFEALEAMKDGKMAKNLKDDCVVFFDEFEVLSYLEDKDNFGITKDDLDAKWQILEGDNE